MVTRIGLFVLGVALASPGYALTADQLRDMTQRAQSNAKDRDSRLTPGDVTPVLPVQRTTNPPARDDAAPSPAAPARAKSAPTPTRRARTASTGEHATAAAVSLSREESPASSTMYRPPIHTASAPTTSDNFIYAAPWTYGIPVGTWLDGELDRAVTNVELSEVSIRVTRPIAGRYRTLEAGATLFGDKIFNSGSRRLEITVRHGVDSNGHAFNLNALVYDASHARVAGLAGEIHKNEDTGTRAGKVSALAVAREGLREITAGNAIAAALGAGADTVINDEARRAEADAAQYVIQVPMQPVQLRIVTAF